MILFLFKFPERNLYDKDPLFDQILSAVKKTFILVLLGNSSNY